MTAKSTIYERRVKDVMSRDVVSIHCDATVHDALNLIVENRVSALPVVDSRDHCVGIISTTDLVDLTRDFDDDVHQLEDAEVSSQWLVEKLIHSVGDEAIQSVMTEAVATINAETTLTRAAREMLRNQVHHLPVVDDRNHLIGILSTMDILAEFADSAPEP
ncbi:MAG: CBS domain-containing protein [Planctomycetales bacterium]|nr:CBS domain-containing protein [Planctomycetales bacterium]